jgi:hypothetical protein
LWTQGTDLDQPSLILSKRWEGFIDEWAAVCLKAKYKEVQRFAGANDKGIDIAGFADGGLLLGGAKTSRCGCTCGALLG